MIEKLDQQFPLKLRVGNTPVLERIYQGTEGVIEELEIERKYLAPDADIEALREDAFRIADIRQRYLCAAVIDPETEKERDVRFRLRHWQVTQDGEPHGEPLRLIRLNVPIDGKKSNTKLERKEVLSQEQFETFWEHAQWQPIHKTRMYIRHVGTSGREYEVHIDRFHNTYDGDTMEGFQMVEVEFRSKDDEVFFHEQWELLKKGGYTLFKDRFPEREPDVPVWLWSATDVTSEPQYRNSRMAQHRRPKEKE